MEKTEENEEKPKGLTSRFKLFFKQEFFKNKVVLWIIASSLALNLANWVTLGIFIKPVDSSIILHYNVYFGVDMVGSWKAVFFLPGIGLLLFFVNFFLALYFYKKIERIACHILLMAGLMTQTSLLIASLSIIFINY
jgi:hypothetical protein